MRWEPKVTSQTRSHEKSSISVASCLFLSPNEPEVIFQRKNRTSVEPFLAAGR